MINNEMVDKVSDINQTNLNPDVTFHGPNFQRNSTIRSSTLSQCSISSKTSVKNVVFSEQTAKKFFCQRENSFEKSQKQCQEKMIDPKIDGDFIGAWILSSVDHWDIEHERIVLLCENSILLARYDFVKLEPLDAKRILHIHIQKVKIGDLIYPQNSWMTPRNHGGIQLIWDESLQLTFSQRWNPLCQSIPYVTLIHHPLLYHENNQEVAIYNVDDFFESFLTAANKAIKKQDETKFLDTEEKEIILESYAGLASMVFNQSHLGYSRERGGVSF